MTDAASAGRYDSVATSKRAAFRLRRATLCCFKLLCCVGPLVRTLLAWYGRVKKTGGFHHRYPVITGSLCEYSGVSRYFWFISRSNTLEARTPPGHVGATAPQPHSRTQDGVPRATIYAASPSWCIRRWPQSLGEATMEERLWPPLSFFSSECTSHRSQSSSPAAGVEYIPPQEGCGGISHEAACPCPQLL